MTFSFVKDGASVKEVWKCDECSWCSTKKHFRSTEDGPECILCRGSASKVETIESDTGISSFKYRELLTYLSEEVNGVGDATIENIQESFEDGDGFLDAVQVAYDSREWGELTDINGIGESTARSIALGIAEHEEWSGGLAESDFELKS